jgi:hypothetical protein
MMQASEAKEDMSEPYSSPTLYRFIGKDNHFYTNKTSKA